MFALPFIFLLAAAGCTVLAAVFLGLGRRMRDRDRAAASSGDVAQRG